MTTSDADSDSPTHTGWTPEAEREVRKLLGLAPLDPDHDEPLDPYKLARRTRRP